MVLFVLKLMSECVLSVWFWTGWLPPPDCSQLLPLVTHRVALVPKLQSLRVLVQYCCSPTVVTLLVKPTVMLSLKFRVLC